MCGIAGIFAYLDVAPAVDRDELARMNARMAPRGPDGSGDWFSADRRIGFAHRRLAIIDLSERGAQPMHSADGTLTITFNGEIYNYRKLKAELEAKGLSFRSDSDTEVLLQLYADRGPAMVEALRGMFAFALWDSRTRRLLLVRDPLGIKPLYYADDGWTIRFASQAKALLAGGAVSRDPDPAGIVGFHLFGSVPDPFTVWRGIRAVPAGSTILVDAAGPEAPRVYYNVAHSLGQRALVRRAGATSIGAADARRQLSAAVHDSVRHHLVADVPVAVFLSAGLDSGTLLGTMAELGARETLAVTLSFAEFKGDRHDEAPLAAEIAARYGARHVVRTVDRAEFERDLPAILDAMDMPTIDGINTWFVAKAAHEAGIKVALSGLGADECFGGYPSFADVPRSVHLMRSFRFIPGLGALVRRVLSSAIASGARLHPKSAGVLQYGGNWAGAYLLRRSVFMPWELDGLLDPVLVAEGLRRLAPLSHIAAVLQSGRPLGDFDRVAAMETSLYMRNQLLRDADWAGMAHSIEIRVPYVDPFFLAALPPGDVLAAIKAKEAVADVPQPPLPEASRNRSKTGFVTPVGRWMRDASGAGNGATGDVTFSNASRAWALRVWQAGWTGSAAA
ncbi:asparagine synthase (glutamine-hydrolyzing) [Reyranella sp.]|uniref:asparagine synthase (glutamine-hydrolyzing) n=1 Tax=Reyranella sp. TaxID=1929291 RepID=UPI003D0FB4FC